MDNASIPRECHLPTPMSYSFRKANIFNITFFDTPYDAAMDTIAKRKQLGSHVRRLRNEHQINRKQFALMIGMDRGYLAGIETGKYNATFDKLVDIADGFGITLSELLEGVGEPEDAAHDSH